jgi:hypothetical protein
MAGRQGGSARPADIAEGCGIQKQGAGDSRATVAKGNGE